MKKVPQYLQFACITNIKKQITEFIVHQSIEAKKSFIAPLFSTNSFYIFL